MSVWNVARWTTKNFDLLVRCSDPAVCAWTLFTISRYRKQSDTCRTQKGRTKHFSLFKHFGASPPAPPFPHMSSGVRRRLASQRRCLILKKLLWIRRASWRAPPTTSASRATPTTSASRASPVASIPSATASLHAVGRPLPIAGGPGRGGRNRRSWSWSSRRWVGGEK
jgi:hypothetical protein